MKFFKLTNFAIVAVMGQSVPILSMAQDEVNTDISVADSIANNFSDFLGDDSSTLVNALRNGDDLSYEVEPTEIITIENGAGPMGFGEISLALGLAESILGEGATQQEIVDVLHNADGGGILDMRADDMGWGQIFSAYGTTVGAVMSRLHANEAAQARLAISQDHSFVRSENRNERSINRQYTGGARPERPERAATPERPERPERPEPPIRTGRP